MILHYLLDPESRHGMNYLAHTYLNYDPIQITSLIGSGARQLTMDMISPDRVTEYAAEDADVTLRLYRVLWPKVEEQGLAGLYLDMEEPLVGVLEAMEHEGVRIDTAILTQYAGELSGQLDELEAQIREVTGEATLNVNSARQLGEVLFGKMRLVEKPKMTKTRQYSTDEETLQGLVGRHPVVELILEYRGVKKLLSTYVEALPLLVNQITGRIHTSYNQTITATGRLSSTNPNLQNIPIREEQGRKIREAFVPSDDDHLLLSADYSQIELRLMAHLSGDKALIEAFRAGEDIHRATAARVFGVRLDEVTSEMRRRAKTVNFGIIYGISAFGLSQRLGIPRTEAKNIIDGYFRSYPGVKEYMERVVVEARETGYVSTIFGRRRFLADINSRNAVARGLAERNAINAPLQGSAADIMKIAMIRVFNGLQEQGLDSKMILQVHDEVIIDMVRSEQETVAKLVVEAMEHAAVLSVDLTVDYGIGENWLTAH
jgi:DNA polymerase-1